jgi:hypothetical protein
MSESIDRIRRQIKDKQIQKIISLQPGRWLDALVAEYVFGYHVENWSAGPDEPADYWYRPHSVIRMLGELEIERVPNYSTVLYAAVQVLPMFKHWSLQGNTESETVSARFSNGGSSQVGVIDCSSIPEAICKAALITLVEDNRILDKLLDE